MGTRQDSLTAWYARMDEERNRARIASVAAQQVAVDRQITRTAMLSRIVDLLCTENDYTRVQAAVDLIEGRIMDVDEAPLVGCDDDDVYRELADRRQARKAARP